MEQPGICQKGLRADFAEPHLPFGSFDPPVSQVARSQSNVVTKAPSKTSWHDRYQDIGQIEQAFRSIKTTRLEIRPIFVRKANRSRADVLIVVLA